MSSINVFHISIEGDRFDLSIDTAKQNQATLTQLPGSTKQWNATQLKTLEAAFQSAMGNVSAQSFLTIERLEKGLTAMKAVVIASEPKVAAIAAAGFPVSAKSNPASTAASAAGAAAVSVQSRFAHELSEKERASKIKTSERELLNICNSLKDKTIDMYALSAAFNIFDDGYGEFARGVSTVAHFNDLTAEALDTDPAAISKGVPGKAEFYYVLAKVGASTTREVSSVHYIDYPIVDFCLLKSNNGNVHYFDQKTGSFLILDEAALAKLQIKDTDLFIQLSPEIEEPSVQDAPTLTSSVASISGKQKGKFYHEFQTSEGRYSSLCGFHAANAFVGKRICSLREFVSHVVDYNRREHGLDIPTSQRVGPSNDTSPLSGNNPNTVKELIVSMAKEGRIDPKFKHMEIASFDSMNVVDKKIAVSSAKAALNPARKKEWDDLLKKFNDPSCDRVIVGYGNSHFVTFRKTDQGRWHVIDSLTNSQITDYASVEECLLNFSRKPNGLMTFIYVNSTVALESELKSRMGDKSLAKPLHSEAPKPASNAGSAIAEVAIPNPASPPAPLKTQITTF